MLVICINSGILDVVNGFDIKFCMGWRKIVY